MEKKELQEFLYFFTHNKSLTRAQQMRRDALLARDYMTLTHGSMDQKPDFKSNEDIQKPNENNNKDESKNNNTISSVKRHRTGVPEKNEYICPKNLQNFLREYNQDDILKYTCHLLDSDEAIDFILKECGTEKYDFLSHIRLIKKHYRNLTWKYKDKNIRLSPNMVTLISVYLTDADFNGNKTVDDRKITWSANEIEISWACNDIIQWSKDNPGIIPNPGENIATKQKSSGYILSRRFRSKITGTPIKSFSELTLFFKSLFHIRCDNSLQSILAYVNKQWKPEDVKISFLENKFNNSVELLTDVDKLIQAYKAIVKLCILNREKDDEPIQIELSFYDDAKSNSTFFIIDHINSVYKKTSKNSIERIGTHQSEIIVNYINGICDLYIEAKFADGNSGRINLWDKNNSFFFQSLNNQITGVKYILKF